MMSWKDEKYHYKPKDLTRRGTKDRRNSENLTKRKETNLWKIESKIVSLRKELEKSTWKKNGWYSKE